MIDFHYECNYVLDNELAVSPWLNTFVKNENKTIGQIDFIFCDDAYLLEVNQTYLKHNVYTDIITFDYCEGDIVSGDIFISLERVVENAQTFEVSVEEELLRVMGHGVLHLMGYNDKQNDDSKIMRFKEDEMIKLFHVEHGKLCLIKNMT